MNKSSKDRIPDEPLLTVEEAARVLRIGRSLAYQLAAEYDASGGLAGMPVIRICAAGSVPPPGSSWKTLLARSTGPVERCEAIATTRTLAKDLGLAKDTVARALVKLRRAGVVNARQTRADAGTFTVGSYVIVVPNCFVLDEQIDGASAPTKRNCATRQIGSQLALSLDD